MSETTNTTSKTATLSSLKTKLAGSAGILVAALLACANDPHFAKWALVLGLLANGIGNFFSRENGTSDQKANARPLVPGVDTP